MLSLDLNASESFAQSSSPRARRHLENDRVSVSLPPFPTAEAPSFVWGSLDGPACVIAINECYRSAIHWRPNLFSVPSGRTGEVFTNELSRLFSSYGTASSLESVAMTAAFLFPLLILQRPSRKTKTKELISHFDRRFQLWSEGAFYDLLSEGNSIQARLPSNPKTHSSTANDHKHLHRVFGNHMMNGKVKSALRLVSCPSDKGELLSLNQPSDPHHPELGSVRETLLSKHPPPGHVNPSTILLDDSNPIQYPHSIVFDNLTGSLVRKMALKCQGAAGPSGLNATSWRRLCSSFKSASSNLCHSLALVARRLCTTFVDPGNLTAFVACRLIALNKNPGVRPIGIGETCRRIISKAILSILGQDIIAAAGPLQLCAGQDSGCEAAVHSIRRLFDDPSSEAILLVDAENAFNSLNRHIALCNTLHLCPSLARVLINTYRNPVDLFINGETIQSTEGTTQGDPLAMAMYALGITPLINHMSMSNPSVKQVWYADDCTICGSIDDLHQWWSLLKTIGPQYGYFPKPSKSWLLTKSSVLKHAQKVFLPTNISITTEGRPILGSPIGSDEYVSKWVSDKVSSWVMELKTLSDIAQSQPQAVYTALTHGLMSHWTYLSRTCPNVSTLLQPLEDTLRSVLIPSITGQAPPSDALRDLFALPCRLGGLGIPIPFQTAQYHYINSLSVSDPLISLILTQEKDIPIDIQQQQLAKKAEIHSSNRSLSKEQSLEISARLSTQQKKLFDISIEKGVSSWLTVLPIRAQGFDLHKGAFKDCLCLRYGWPPSSLPTSCACGSVFSIDHAFNCPLGGFPSIRHDGIRDLTAKLMREVCRHVSVEPILQPLTGETLLPTSAISSNGARLDIRADGFWECDRQTAFFDVRIFNPTSHTSRNRTLQANYRRHEQEKRRHYEDRVINVEHGCFTPLVFSTAGGYGPAAKIAINRLASLLSCKWDTQYSKIISWIRCKIGFALQHSAIMCLRGTRSRRTQLELDPYNVDLALTQGTIPI